MATTSASAGHHKDGSSAGKGQFFDFSKKTHAINSGSEMVSEKLVSGKRNFGLL